MDTLWAGWRREYVKVADERAAEGCLFCVLPNERDEDALIVEHGALAYTVLNRYPYTTGHLMVTPIRHVAGLTGLTTPERVEVWSLLERAIAACEAVLRPQGFNWGANMGRVAGAGIPDHLHIHLVPRWSADTNFMTAVGDARVLPEDLSQTWANLWAALADQGPM